MMIGYCCLNSSERLKPSEFERIYLVKFYDRGYWSLRLCSIDRRDAKRKLKEIRPNAEYKKSSLTK